MQENELLTKVYGEVHELLGEHREFKRDTIARFSSLESDMKTAAASRLSNVGTLVSIITGVVAIGSAFAAAVAGGAL